VPGNGKFVTANEAAERFNVPLKTMRSIIDRWGTPPHGKIKMANGHIANVYPWKTLAKNRARDALRPACQRSPRHGPPPTEETLRALWMVLDHIAPCRIPV